MHWQENERKFINRILSISPSIKTELCNEEQYFGDSYSLHGVCSLLARHVDVLLLCENNISELKKIFGFIEECVEQEDELIMNPVHVTLLENLTLAQEKVPTKKFMGLRTLEIVRWIERDMKLPE